MGLRSQRISALVTLALVTCVYARGRDKTDWSNLKSLVPGQRLTIDLTDGQKEKAEYRGFSEDSLNVRSRIGDISIRRITVRKVSVGSGRTRLRNMGMGLGMGAGVGALIAMK